LKAIWPEIDNCYWLHNCGVPGVTPAFTFKSLYLLPPWAWHRPFQGFMILLSAIQIN